MLDTIRTPAPNCPPSPLNDMTGFIPQAAPNLRIGQFRDAVSGAVRRVLESDNYGLGPDIDRFEQAFATYLGIGHCVGVGSGTDALAIAFRALSLPREGEIVTVAMTASATGSAILLGGYVPRFVDVDRESRLIDIDHLAAAVGPRTVAIVPVHLHGNPVDMPRLMTVADALGLPVIEDCAQAHGARTGGRPVGTFGRAAAFSFYPTKNLGCAGDGGLLATHDGEVAERARALREHGWGPVRGRSDVAGFNSRLSAIQAAILCELLPHLDEGNAERVRIAERYRLGFEAAANARSIGLPPGNGRSVYHQFAVEVDNRDRVRERLQAAGIGTAVHYALPLNRQPAFAEFSKKAHPNSDALAGRLLSLPIQPEVAGPVVEEIIERVVDAVSRS